MKRDLPTAANPDLDRLFREISEEEAGQMIRERRSNNREPLVRPVRVVSLEDGHHDVLADGFSKNFSPAGLGIVTRSRFVEGLVAVLEVHRFGKPPAAVLAECRWCDSFGEGWFMSGWKFRSMARR
jgi:PilZ domain